MAHDEDWSPISYNRLDEIEPYRRFFNAEDILMTHPSYLNNARAKTLRPIALNAIEAYYKCDDDFDAFIPYLAMNYFDRIISRYKIEPVRDDEKRNEDLFVICCLTLAWKTRTRCSELPYLLGELQRDYEERDFIVMEFFIQQKLKGKVRSLTPFTFVDYFIATFRLTRDQVRPTRKLVHQIIVTSQADMRIATLRPALVAASAVYVASKKLLPKHHSSILQQILVILDYITKEELLTGEKMLQPICNAMIRRLKSSSAKKDAKAETSRLGLGRTSQLAGASSSSQPKPAVSGASVHQNIKPDQTGDVQLGSASGEESEGGAYGSGLQGTGQVARASSSSQQEPSPGDDDKKGKSIPIGSGAPGSGELSTQTEEIQQDPTPAQAQASASASASASYNDLKLDFELGWSKYDELIRDLTMLERLAACTDTFSTTIATTSPHCCCIL